MSTCLDALYGRAPTVPAVNTPGSQGATGPGAYTATTTVTTIPAIGSTVTIDVASSVWMVIGQKVIVGKGVTSIANPGPATFQITAIPSTTSFTGQFLGAAGDASPAATISIGAVVTPAAGVNYVPSTVYASGTVYTFTNSDAALNFGTTDPELTVAAGTYLLLARVRVDYNAATITTQTLRLSIYNVTSGANVTNAVGDFDLVAVTTTSQGVGWLVIPFVVATFGASTNLALHGYLSAAAGAGTVDASEACLVAVRLY